jgi:hypothetical protein
MHLSISSSRKSDDPRAGLEASLALGVVLIFLSIGLEFTCRLGVPRISRLERKSEEEYQSIVRAGKMPASGSHVIVLGNSLLNSGVRFDEARRMLAPEIDARRWVVLDTGYPNWYYGIRRLLAEGARPEVVILMLTPRQIVVSEKVDNYFGYRMMMLGDLLSVASDLDLSNTETSSLAFANLSGYFGLGAIARKWVAGRVFPGLPRLTQMMTHGAPVPLTEEQIYSGCVPKLRALANLTAAHRCRFILMVPPTRGGESEVGCRALERATSATGVPVLTPMRPNALPQDCYSDRGFHLNERGAEVFTPAFVKAIREELGVSCQHQ